MATSSISPGIALNQLTKTVQERYSVNVRGIPKNVIESVYRSITEGRLQMPPLVLSEDKTMLIDRKSPLSGKDYKVLFDSASTKRKLYRLADKMHLFGYKELKKSEIVNQIKEKLLVTGISEPILIQVKRKSKNTASPLPNNVPFNNESPGFNNKFNNNQTPKFNNNNQSLKFNNNKSPTFNSPKINNNKSPTFNSPKNNNNNSKTKTNNKRRLKVPSVGIKGRTLSTIIPSLNIGGGYNSPRMGGGLFSFGRTATRAAPGAVGGNRGQGFFSSLFRGMRRVPVNENTEIDKYTKIYQNEFLIEQDLARSFATFYVKSFKQNPSMPIPQLLNVVQFKQFIQTHKNTIIITYKKYKSITLSGNHVKLLYKAFILPLLNTDYFKNLADNSKRNKVLKYFIYYLENNRIPTEVGNNNDFRSFITNFESNSNGNGYATARNTNSNSNSNGYVTARSGNNNN